MSVLLAVLAAIGMTFFKGWQTGRQLAERNYSWAAFALMAPVWVLVTAMSAVVLCNEFACRVGLRFGGLAELIARVSGGDGASLGQITSILMTAYAILTVYVLGHCLGWALYGVKRLYRSIV